MTLLKYIKIRRKCPSENAWRGGFWQWKVSVRGVEDSLWVRLSVLLRRWFQVRTWERMLLRGVVAWGELE